MAVDYDEVAKYFSGRGTPRPGSIDIAKAILLNAGTNFKAGPGVPKGGNEPSLMGRIFDILSRPNYAVANFAKGIVQGDPDLSDIVSGLSGTQKTTFSDVLAAAGLPSGAVRSGLGLALDIGLDPTTYIPGAAIAKGASKVLPTLGKASKATPPVESKTYIQNLLSRGEPINPELFGLSTRSSGEIPVALRKAENKEPIRFSPSLEPQSGVVSSIPQLDLPGISNRLPLPKITTPTRTAPEFKDKNQLGLFPSPGSLESLKPRNQAIADSILKSWRSSSNTITARQQVSIYQKILDEVKSEYVNPSKAQKSIEENAFRTYLVVEKALESKGYIPRIATGEKVRLSDVVNRVGGASSAKTVITDFANEIKEGTPAWSAVQALRISGAIDEAESVKSIVDKISESKVAVDSSNTLSDKGIKNFEKHLISLAKKATQADPNIGPLGTNVAKKLINTILVSGKSPAEVVLQRKSSQLDNIIASGQSRSEVNSAVTRALESNLGQLPRWAVNNNNAVEFLMARIATWWGQKDLRPMSLNAIGSASATAAARGKALASLLKPYSIDQQLEALRVTQGLGKPSNIDVARLSDQLTKMMDNLSSVMHRAGVDIDMVNKWLRHYNVGFEFSNDQVKNIIGQSLDFSKGTDWLNSWKVADIKTDPGIFLFKVQQAIEQATREKALFDEIGERFGAKTYGGPYRTKIKGYKYIDGYYFTEDIAKQIARVVKDWSTPFKLSDNSALKFYDRLLSMWKSGVTIYRPAHHIRNMVGDAYLGWMDGVNTVRPYTLAIKVLRSMRGAYDSLSDVDRLVDLGVVGKQFKTPHPGEVIFRNKSGVPFTADQIGAVAHQKGLLEHTSSIEDIIDLGEHSRFRPLGGKVQSVARGASELQSHSARLAHFIDKVMKSRGSDLEKIFEEASRRARKWHPTGLDLTNFEKKVLRRIIPFYSWVRKATPLLIEGMVMNPGKVAIPSKVYGAVQESQGIETPGRADPFPVDQMFPEWIRAYGVGPVSAPDGILGKISNQQPPGYIMAGLGLNPLSDLIAQMQNPGKSALTSLTPVAQIPIELSTGRKLFTGEPISGIDARPDALEEYVGQNIPIWSAIQGMTGVTPFGTETKAGVRSSGEAGKESLVNWLTSAGIKGTGPYIRQARAEQTIPIRTERKYNREAFLDYLRSLQ